MSTTLSDDPGREISQSELSEPLNITAFDTATHTPAGDTANEAEAGKFIEIGGKICVSTALSQSTARHQTIIDMGSWARASSLS
jgi:hypothetical protein